MQITMKISRFNPEKDQKAHFESYILEVDAKDRILDVLEQVRGYHDASLAYRRTCAHGVCGSDAMRINGRNHLACKILVQDLNSSEITIEPIMGLKVIKDLIVDMEPFFDHFKSLTPYLVNDEPLPADGKERLQSPEERERFDDTTKCILCAACTTSCPSFWSDGSYVGPAAIVNAHRFIFDSRDHAAAERLKVLNEQFGVWRCRTAFNCTEACPRDIHVTKAIAEVKQALISGKLK
jgi:succinate dehydrogenase / fumarate reductase, iron-sulfur subunit